MYTTVTTHNRRSTDLRVLTASWNHYEKQSLLKIKISIITHKKSNEFSINTPSCQKKKQVKGFCLLLAHKLSRNINWKAKTELVRCIIAFTVSITNCWFLRWVGDSIHLRHVFVVPVNSFDLYSIADYDSVDFYGEVIMDIKKRLPMNLASFVFTRFPNFYLLPWFSLYLIKEFCISVNYGRLNL